jgi:hypothetical protein
LAEQNIKERKEILAFFNIEVKLLVVLFVETLKRELSAKPRALISLTEEIYFHYGAPCA